MKRTLMTAVFSAALALIAMMYAQTPSALSAAQQKSPLPENEIKRGLNLSPVPLNLTGKDARLVGLGSYIVNAQGGCSDCHTNPSYAEGGNPFLGQPEIIPAENYLAGGTSFGPFVSRNLTPDAKGKPAGMTYEEFALVMRTGSDLKNLHPQLGPLLQVMPWPTYGKMTELDLRAIYEYLRAIPPAQTPTLGQNR